MNVASGLFLVTGWPVFCTFFMSQASESSELANPLLDNVEHTSDGSLMLVGNRTLLSLNLSSKLERCKLLDKT